MNLNPQYKGNVFKLNDIAKLVSTSLRKEGAPQLSPIVLSAAADNSLVAHCSTPRAVMHSNHIASRPSLLYPEKKHSIISGIEYEFGTCIDDVRTSEDCSLKSSISKFPDHPGNNAETQLIVEFEKINKEGEREIWLDLITVPYGKSNHTYFGYKLEHTDALTDARYNQQLPKDTILAKTDSLHEDGSYMYGVNANYAMISHPVGAEDGFGVSKSFLEKLKFTTYSTRVIYIDKKQIPVNLFGDDKIFKMFPDIGERVRDGGLLCALRERNDLLSIADLNNEDICRVDHTFDVGYYVPEDSIVVDIKVIKGNNNKTIYSENMVRQIDYYYHSNVVYAEGLVRNYNKAVSDLKARFSKSFEPRLTGKLRAAITDAMVLVESSTSKRRLRYKSMDIDQYRIEITCMSVVTPDLGFKLSGLSADRF